MARVTLPAWSSKSCELCPQATGEGFQIQNSAGLLNKKKMGGMAGLGGLKGKRQEESHPKHL